MNRKYFSLVLLLFAFLAISMILFATAQPANANSPAQVYYMTPTPDDLGRVVYVVQAGETCISISLKNNISQEDLRLLNNLDAENCSVYEGQQLLLAVIEEPTAMPITPTPTSLFPTPTPFAGYVTMCIRLYEDINGNAVREEGEILLPDGAASITSPLGDKSWNGITVYDTELCFEEIPAGEYNVSVAVPAGYNVTTNNSQQVIAAPGETALINFGAQSSGQLTAAEEAAPSQEGKSPVLAIVGGLMLLAGVGLGIYMAVWSKRKNQF